MSSSWYTDSSSAWTRTNLWREGNGLRVKGCHHLCGPLTTWRLNSQRPMASTRNNCKRSPAKPLEPLIGDCFQYRWNLWGMEVMNYPEVALSVFKLRSLWFSQVQVGFPRGHLSTPLSVGQCSAGFQAIALYMEGVPDCQWKGYKNVL